MIYLSLSQFERIIMHDYLEAMNPLYIIQSQCVAGKVEAALRGVWCVVCDVWWVVGGVWYVVCDVWCVVCGVWCVVWQCVLELHCGGHLAGSADAAGLVICGYCKSQPHP